MPPKTQRRTRDHLDVPLVDTALEDEVSTTVALIVLANERTHLVQSDIDRVLLGCNSGAGAVHTS